MVQETHKPLYLSCLGSAAACHTFVLLHMPVSQPGLWAVVILSPQPWGQVCCCSLTADAAQGAPRTGALVAVQISGSASSPRSSRWQGTTA